MKVRRFSQKNGSFWPNWPIGRPIRPICQFSPIGTFCPIGGQFANWQVRKSDDLAGLFGGLSYLANWPIGCRSYCDSLVNRYFQQISFRRRMWRLPGLPRKAPCCPFGREFAIFRRKRTHLRWSATSRHFRFDERSQFWRAHRAKRTESS